jgi:hypothetical protein
MWKIPLHGCILNNGGDALRWKFVNESQSIVTQLKHGFGDQIIALRSFTLSN